MKRLCKASSRWDIKRSGVGHVNKAKFASLYEKADHVDVDEDDERQQQQQQQPGKTLRMFVCSKCGKGFQSSKALCGHMACHSVKEKASRKKKQQLVIMDSQSDTESVAKSLTRRSMRGKCKKFAEDHVAVSRSSCSSEASGVEQEQEEVAISLMMLSRDSSNWGRLNSIGDSSENNSVVLEARSVSTKKATNQYSNRVIHSHQAFNMPADYKTFKAASTPESGKNSSETDGSVDISKGNGFIHHFSNNVKECPICFKEFRSVQAFGGHRRVHLATEIFKGNVTQLHNFIDLNLPAPMEDEEAS